MLIIIWLFFVCWLMSFFTPIETPIETQTPIVWSEINFPENLNFDHVIVDYISNYAFVDSLTPILPELDIYNYYIKNNNYYHPTFPNYNDYLADYVTRLGNIFKFTEEQAYYQILMSTFKKMYIFNYSNNELDRLDWFILDWAKNNVSFENIGNCKDYVLRNSENVVVFKYNKNF